MSKPIFVPTAVPVENVASALDPDNPNGGLPGLPEGERPFDWNPDFPLRAERFGSATSAFARVATSSS